MVCITIYPISINLAIHVTHRRSWTFRGRWGSLGRDGRLRLGSSRRDGDLRRRRMGGALPEVPPMTISSLESAGGGGPGGCVSRLPCARIMAVLQEVESVVGGVEVTGNRGCVDGGTKEKFRCCVLSGFVWCMRATGRTIFSSSAISIVPFTSG